MLLQSKIWAKSYDQNTEMYEEFKFESNPILMRTFRPSFPLCQEASNCSILHPSGRFSSTARWHSCSTKLQDFFPKHRYGKIAATVRMMWIPVQMRSSIRQVSHQNPDVRTPVFMIRTCEHHIWKIVCIRSTVWTTVPLVQTSEASIGKLRAAEVRPSGRQCNTVRTWFKSGKNFSKFLESRSHSCPSKRFMTTVRTAPRVYQARCSV